VEQTFDNVWQIIDAGMGTSDMGTQEVSAISWSPHADTQWWTVTASLYNTGDNDRDKKIHETWVKI